MTAEEFFMEYLGVDCDFMESMREQLDKCSGFNYGTITDTMIEFAKLHAQAALEAAAENANMVGETQHNNNAPDIIRDFVYVVDSNGPDYGFTVNKDSILNAYNLDNII